MKHVRQRPRSCGPACVAMLAGCDLDVATYAIGSGASSVADVARALRRFGLRLGRRHVLHGRLPPARARGLLVLVQMRTSWQHVAVLAGDGTVLDPAARGPVRLERYPQEMARTLLATAAWFEVDAIGAARRLRRVG